LKKKEHGVERKKWQESIADFFELPKEVLMNLPRVTLIGNIQLYLENYSGVIEYNQDILRLSIKGGEIVIRGHELVIKNLFSEEIYIEGNIQSIEYR